MTEGGQTAAGASGLSRLVLLVFLLLLTDGYDMQAAAYVAPVLAGEWGVPRPAFGPVFSAGLLGYMLGAMALTALADRRGAKPVLLASVTAYAVLSAVAASVQGLNQLLLVRFATGVALGGAMPTALAMVSRRATGRNPTFLVALAATGFSLGAGLGGAVAAALVETHGWRSVFLVGAAGPALLLPVLAWGLPKTERSSARSVPVEALFTGGLAVPTLAIWLVYALNLLGLYTLSSWMPSLIHASGSTAAGAALVTGAYQAAGALGGLALARLAERGRPTAVLAVAFAAGALGALLLGAAGQAGALLYGGAMLAGLGFVGAQSALNGFVSQFYPEEARATGLGWALGAGRIGSIAGPLAAGALLAAGAGPRAPLALCAVPATAAALVVAALGRSRRA